jgi:hypothetical protein
MRIVTLILIIISLPFVTKSQSNAEKDEVMAVIFELFDGYREGDSAKVSATFAPGAQMQRVAARDGKMQVTPLSSVQGWLDYIGSGLEKEHDEPIWDYSVQIDNGLASVWTKFAFFLDGTFSHCGVDNFLLARIEGEWKIFHVVDTNQKEGCDIPDAIRQKSEKK